MEEALLSEQTFRVDFQSHVTTLERVVVLCRDTELRKKTVRWLIIWIRGVYATIIYIIFVFQLIFLVRADRRKNYKNRSPVVVINLATPVVLYLNVHVYNLK